MIYFIRLEIDKKKESAALYSQLEFQLGNLFKQIFQLIYTHKLNESFCCYKKWLWNRSLFNCIDFKEDEKRIHSLESPVFNLDSLFLISLISSFIFK